MSLNKIFLHGRLTNIPELRRTQNDKSVATFTVAVDRDSKSQQADFINCVAWEKRAEFVCSYFTKGQEILLEGSLNTRSYTDKDGNHRTVQEVIVNKIDFCGPKGTAARDKDGTERRPKMQEDTFYDVEDGGELPF